MYAKRIKRKCMVRGCGCTDTFAISKTREAGSSVIVCRACLEEATEVIKGAGEPLPRKPQRQPKPLFFAAQRAQETADVTEAAEEVKTAEEAEAAVYVCAQCGREYKTAAGLSRHEKNCEGGTADE